MSSTPIVDDWPPHVSGTTFGGVAYLWTDGDDTPFDFTGSDARFVAVDSAGAVVFDWYTADPDKPGVDFVDPETGLPDPTAGAIYLAGPGGALSAPLGTLSWDLKVWHATTGESFVDVAGRWPILHSKTP